MRRFVLICLLVAASMPDVQRAGAQGTSAFSYQGQLASSGGPATGGYQLVFRLYDAVSGGNLRGGPLTNSVFVANGLFTAELDFGAQVFAGNPLWLEIGVRTNGSGAAHTLLSPRQRVTATPYAVYAVKAGDLQSGASPTFTGAVTFNPVAGPPFSVGNNMRIRNLNADLLDGLDSSQFLLKAGDTMTGHLTLANPASLHFGNSTRQMVNLWGLEYGIGVQAGALYFRSDGHFAWYRGGTHSDVSRDPGPGGTALMHLNNSGNLTVIGHNNSNVVRLVGPAGAFGYGARLNFGDAEYAYLQEDVDDSLKIYANRIMLSGNVGIGTATPAATLHVAGGIRADVFQFSTPRQHVLTIGAAEFRAGRSDNASAMVELHDPERAAGATVSPGGIESPGIVSYVIAPVSLPHGAAVTQVTFWLYNNGTALPGPSFNFRRVRHDDQTAVTTIASRSAPGWTGIQAYSVSPSGSVAFIDNLTYQYYIKSEFSTLYDGVRAVVIRYTTLEAD